MLAGRGALLRRAAPLLRAAALRAVLHPQLALVQLAFADREVLESVAFCLFRRSVFKHIRAEQLDERAAVLIIEIGKSLAVKGQKGEVTIALVEPAALSRGAAVGKRSSTMLSQYSSNSGVSFPSVSGWFPSRKSQIIRKNLPACLSSSALMGA